MQTLRRVGLSRTRGGAYPERVQSACPDCPEGVAGVSSWCGPPLFAGPKAQPAWLPLPLSPSVGMAPRVRRRRWARTSPARSCGRCHVNGSAVARWARISCMCDGGVAATPEVVPGHGLMEPVSSSAAVSAALQRRRFDHLFIWCFTANFSRGPKSAVRRRRTWNTLLEARSKSNGQCVAERLRFSE